MATASSVPAPNLTEHFKQALNMTKMQYQSGSNPLTSATQMGVNTPMQNFGSSGLTSVENIGSADMLPVHEMTNNSNTGGMRGFIHRNSRFIIILSIIVIVGLGLYFFWWKKRKVSENFTQQEALGGTRGDRRQISSVYGENGEMNQRTQRISNPRPQLNAVSQYFNQPQSQQVQNLQNLPSQFTPSSENIRDNEQQMAVRGAEFANPNFVSHMMPVSSRISAPQVISPPPPQTQPSHLPPQAQLQAQAQPQLQLQPQIQIPVSQPQIQIPISQPQFQIPISQTQSTTQSEPQQIQLPISPSVPPPPITHAPVSDPNFTAI